MSEVRNGRKFRGRVDVLINAVYNKNIKLKGIFKMRVKK